MDFAELYTARLGGAVGEQVAATPSAKHNQLVCVSTSSGWCMHPAEAMPMNSRLLIILVFICCPLMAYGQSMPPNYTFGVQAGSYIPNIDSQFESSQGSVKPPYEEAFQDDLVLRLELQRNLTAPFFDRHKDLGGLLV